MTPVLNINSNYYAAVEKPVPGPTSFGQRAIAHLTAAEEKLDHLIPNFSIQNKIDYFLQKIEEAFQPVKSQGHLEAAGNWKEELARFLAGLPVKTAGRILFSLRSLCQTILQGAIYTAAHPMKAPLELAKKIVLLAQELSQPEAWMRIGANSLGSSIGYSLITPNPLSAISLLIGSALVTAGISATMLKSANKTFLAQGKAIAEELVSGICLGMLIGGIQSAVKQFKQWKQNVSYDLSFKEARMAAAKNQAQNFVQSNDLPVYDRIRWQNDSVSIYYDPKRFLSLPKELPDASVVFDSFITKIQTFPAPNPNGGVGGFSFIETRTEMMGYKFPFQKWQAPAAPLPIPPVANLSNEVLLASVGLATASK